MTTYSLYKFRKKHANYPYDRVQVHVNKNDSWLVMERELDNAEVEAFDLEYIGENMTYDRVQSEIARMSR